jgi:hypothetical protein
MKNIRFITGIISCMIMALSACTPAQFGSLSPAEPITRPVDQASAAVEASPVWLTVPVVDTKTAKSFAVGDLKGKVVLMEGMVTWCPSCWAQGREIKKLYGSLGKNTDLVIISLDMDTKENAQDINDYIKIDQFEWQFVTSSLPMYHDLGNRYGALYLDPTLTPFLVVDRKGQVSHFESGLKTAEELKNILEPLLNAS